MNDDTTQSGPKETGRYASYTINGREYETPIYNTPNTHQSSGAAAWAVLAIVMFACFGGGVILGMLAR